MNIYLVLTENQDDPSEPRKAFARLEDAKTYGERYVQRHWEAGYNWEEYSWQNGKAIGWTRPISNFGSISIKIIELE